MNLPVVYRHSFRFFAAAGTSGLWLAGIGMEGRSGSFFWSSTCPSGMKNHENWQDFSCAMLLYTPPNIIWNDTV